jgi:hypothetical protein
MRDDDLRRRMQVLDEVPNRREWPALGQVQEVSRPGPVTSGWRRAGTAALALAISAAAVALVVRAFPAEPSKPESNEPAGAQSVSPCAPITEDTQFRDTALGQWLATVLTNVGAPAGHGLGEAALVEEDFAYSLDVPAYRGRFEINVSAEEPDPENVDVSFLPVRATSGNFTLRGAFTGEEGFQQFLIIGEGVWVSVYVIPTPDRIPTPVMVEWFERVADRAQISPAPVCTGS